MATGFPGRASAGAEFYSSGRTGVGSPATINTSPVQYRSQLGGILTDPSSIIVPRQIDMAVTRSLAELQRQHLQQQQDVGVFLRSVKQRSNYHHTSPISPLSPVDFMASGQNLSGRYGIPVLQQLQPQVGNPNSQTHVPYCNPSLSGLSYSDFVPNRAVVLESEPDSVKKMRNQLQELEKQLLDDDDNEEDEGDAASVITGSEWSETMQNLMTPTTQKPLSPSPTTSSSPSSSSSSSSSPSSYSSGCSKQSLMEAAVAISEYKIDAATAILSHLIQVSNKRGDPEQRLTAYMVSALQTRMKTSPEIPSLATELCNNEAVVAIRMLYEASPCFKLGFMAANLAILEATKYQPNKNVHVLDFDIGLDSQYVTLILALAARQSSEKSTIVKITTVTEPGNNNEERLRLVEERLRILAEEVGVGLKFNVVNSKISDLSRDSLGCDADDALAVNFAFRLYKIPDESVSTENPRDTLLRLVKVLAPLVVTLVEQEMNANTALFVSRVAEVSSYYGALFHSLDSTMTRDATSRVRVEELLGRKAANSVACEGRERVERCEVFGKWRARMGMAGFKAKPMTQQVAESMRSKLATAYPNKTGFTIKEEAGGICFGWMDRVLTVASAWC